VKTRLIAGLVGLAIILPLLFLGPPVAVEILVLVATAVALWEFAGIALPGRQRLAFAAMGPAGLAVHMAVVWGADASVLPTMAIATLGCLLFGLFAVDETDAGAKAATRMVMGLLYIAVLFSFLSAVRHLRDGVTWVFVSLLLAWLGDTGAYFAGRAFGSRKLFPRVSPKKTWEGAIGGAVVVVAGMAVVKLVAVPHMGWGHVIALGLLGDVAGVVGDLVESMLKREAGVKDAGSFLPGHGGILDRIDSLLFTAPLTWLYVTITGLG
jgi:phosphatidate cytidylyltransferase